MMVFVYADRVFSCRGCNGIDVDIFGVYVAVSGEILGEI